MSTQPSRPLVITPGDPAGVGPELIAKAWARRKEEQLPPFVVMGSQALIEAAAQRRGIKLQTFAVEAERAAESDPSQLPVLGGIEAPPYRPGEPDREGAMSAARSLHDALKFLRAGHASALVTGPVSKAAIAAVEPGFIGQTEACADACGVSRNDAVMMLAGPSLRTVPLTVHCALAEVPGRLSIELIVNRARIVSRALQSDFGIEQPRLAIAGLNPHAGEEGNMGREEIEIIVPTIAALRDEGIEASGPHPADALFTARARTTYDAALCMYHDQALIPLKALEFDQGVNVTLGLPIIRTSPDHGTAFDIAGKGIADPGAMIAAIRMAGEMAARRATHG